MKIKKYIAVSSLIAVLVIMNSCTKKNDLDWYGLNGKVKSFTENHYNVKVESGKWVKGDPAEYGNERISFDRNRNYEFSELLNQDNSVHEKTVPTRIDGEIVEDTWYNGNGEIIGRSKYSNMSDTGHTIVSYDEYGKKTSLAKSYLKNDRIVGQEIYLDVGEKIIYEYEYDENGNMSGYKQKDSEGNVMLNPVYKYTKFDKYNNWTEKFKFPYEKSNRPEKIVTRVYEYYD